MRIDVSNDYWLCYLRRNWWGQYFFQIWNGYLLQPGELVPCSVFWVWIWHVSFRVGTSNQSRTVNGFICSVVYWRRRRIPKRNWAVFKPSSSLAWLCFFLSLRFIVVLGALITCQTAILWLFPYLKHTFSYTSIPAPNHRDYDQENKLHSILNWTKKSCSRFSFLPAAAASRRSSNGLSYCCCCCCCCCCCSSSSSSFQDIS